MIEQGNNRSFDLRIFLTVVCILIIIGSIFIYAASSVYALEHFGSAHYFVRRRLFGLALGTVAFIITQWIPIKLYSRASSLFLGVSTLITSLTLIPGLTRHIHGSSRWLNLAGLAFQPSELLKIAVILYLATFISRTTTRQRESWRIYVPLCIAIGIPCLLLLRQPDFGLTVSILFTTLIMLFIAQIPLMHIGLLIGSLCTAAITLIVIKPYRMQRILTFLNPWNDPQGAGFQIIQSLIAIGSGGIFGVGIGNSKQKFFYLPMQCTDFIFSIIAEETGFCGAFALIMLYLCFMYFGIRLAYKTQSTFGFFTIVGFILIISMQTIINIAVVTGLAPTKGIGLPFISHGDTALICNIVMIGIIVRIIRDQSTTH